MQCHVPSPGALEKRGVGALELVAMDMKTRYGMSFQVCCTVQLNGSDYEMVCKMFSRQSSYKFSYKLAPLTASIVDFMCRGMYVCRTLSFKGADFSIDEVPLENRMQVCDL